MAKTQPPATARSAVTRLLDPQALADHFAEHQSDNPARRVPTVTSPYTSRHASGAEPIERPTTLYKREVTFCEETDAMLRALSEQIRGGTRTRLTTSQVMRSLVRAFGGTTPMVEAACQRMGTWKLPGNARHQQADRDRFERRLAEAMSQAMQAWAISLDAPGLNSTTKSESGRVGDEPSS